MDWVLIVILAAALWSTHSKLKQIQADVADLGERLGSLERAGLKRKVQETVETPYVTQTVAEPIVQNPYKPPSVSENATYEEFDEVLLEEAPVEKAYTKAQPVQKESVEFNLGAKLPVWIGAVCLICAGFFLIRYSIEIGLLGPGMRTFFGGVFGLILAGTGRYLDRRDDIANNKRISQGLAGAGVVLLYFTIYAAVNMYHLMSPTMGFANMAVVTAASVILSLRIGQPIAIFALVGGLLTPALMSTNEPNAVLLFSYLFVMSAGMLYMLVQRGWWALSTFVVIGFFGWVAFWDATNFVESDRWTLVLFSMALVGVVLAITGKFSERDEKIGQDNPAFVLNTASVIGGFLTMCLLGVKVTLSLFDWSMLALLSTACVAMAHYRWGYYKKLLLAKLIADIGLFLFWMQSAAVMPNDIGIAVAELALVYVAFPAFLLSRTNKPAYWASIQSIFAFSFYIMCYLHFIDLPDFSKDTWAFEGLALGALAIGMVALMHRRFADNEPVQERVMSIYALTATAFISLGLQILLPSSVFSLAVAGEIFALACLFYRFKFQFLQTISVILAVLFIGLNCEMILSFAGLMISSFFGSHHSILGNFTRPVEYLDKLFMCIALLGGAFVLYEDKNTSLPKILFGITVGLFCAFAYFMIGYISHGAISLAFEADFIERGFISLALAGTGIGVFYLWKRYDIAFFETIALALIHLVFFRIAWFDLIVHNPYFSSSQHVGATPFINGITLTYGGGLLLTAWMFKNIPSLQRVYGAFGLVILFALTSLTIAQLFHGDSLSPHETQSMELYSYSIVWLLTSLVLLFIGMGRNSKEIRVAAMAFMTLTIGKVFLVDAGELHGLYRIFSFFGLGVCLIGLSYFYTRFVSKNDKA